MKPLALLRNVALTQTRWVDESESARSANAAFYLKNLHCSCYYLGIKKKEIPHAVNLQQAQTTYVPGFQQL